MALLGRDTLVTGPLPDGSLLLETFQGKEALGAPYVYHVTLLSDDPGIPVDAVLGQPLTIQIKLDTGDFRNFNGVVTYFAKTGLSVRHTRYAAILNPTLTLFDYARDCRIYFDAKADDLAKHVLSHHRHGANVEIGLLDGEYRVREYCVQYRESYFNFIQRLFEEEGIYYFFKHAKNKHTMVLADSATAHAKVQGYETVMVLPRERKQVRDQEHFWSLTVAGSLYAGKFTTLQGYDYGKPRPRTAQLQIKPSAAGEPGPDFDDYDNPGGLTESGDAEADAAVRLGNDLVANTVIEVEGNTMGLGVGDLVSLARASADPDYSPLWKEGDVDKEYLITSASYSISINQYETGDVASSDEPFRATFTLLDSQIPFRPRRRAHKPRIEGPQTAVVVGPGGEEIYTDKFGRVRVQFDWDRIGQSDQESSCWVRVAQVWAGKQWGAMHIPRIGQEVIVEFLDGDPDRPIITGRVYNADSMPPYALPEHKTQSGIKSRSSKSGTASNFNELRFEDLKGSEEVYLQAEKDMNILVKSDETRLVGHDRTKEVKNDETSTIHGNRTETVVKDESITIQGNRTEIVGKDENITIAGARTESVGKDESIAIGGSRKEAVGQNESVAIGGARSGAVAGNETLAIGGARQVDVGGADSLNVAGGRTQDIVGGDQLKVSKKALVDAGDEIMLKSGDASITLKKDGTIILKGKDISFKASGKIIAKASSDITMKGSKISGN
jgi:type VI secretion system secreted protein VgrG